MKFYDFDIFLKKVYNEIPVNKFKGNVLYLGMGSLWVPRLQGENVKRTVIIEKDINIIEKYKKYVKEDWVIINQDVYDFKTDEVFDFIFADIWDSKTRLSDVLNLKKQYLLNLKNDDSFIYLKKIIIKNSITDGNTL